MSEGHGRVTCRGMVAHSEPEAGGMNFYIYVTCEGDGIENFALPRMVKDSLKYSTDHIEITLVRRSRNLKSVRLNRERGLLEIELKEKGRSAFILNLWMYTDGILYPLLSDIDIVKNTSKAFEFVDLKGETLRERSGIVTSIKGRSVNVKDLRTYTWIAKNMRANCVDPLIYPPRSLVLSYRDKTYFMKIGGVREEIATSKSEVKLCASFPYGKIVALATSSGVEIYQHVGEEWKLRSHHEIPYIRDLDWCIFMNKISLGISSPDKYIISTLGGDLTMIELRRVRRAKISPYGDKLAVVYKDHLEILDMDSGDKQFEIKMSNINALTWSPYGDYLLFCNESNCSIYSTLTESIVIGKPIRGVKNVWWSPHTLSVYLQREESTTLWFLDPHMVRSKQLVMRLPSYLRT